MCRWNSEKRIIILYYIQYNVLMRVCRVPIWTTQDEMAMAPTKWVVHARCTRCCCVYNIRICIVV